MADEPTNEISGESYSEDVPRIFAIRERDHRIHNPFTAEELRTLGEVLRLKSGMTVLDLGSGSGEMLCTWAKDYGIAGVGVDLSKTFTEAAHARAAELNVADSVRFVHADAAGYTTEPVDIAACVGATWIGGGVAGAITLLEESLEPGGTILIGEPYWRKTPPSQEIIEDCEATRLDDFLGLPELLEQFGDREYDVVQMVLANQDGWDRYMAAQWMSMREWLDENPDDEMADEIREALKTEPARYARSTREYVGWGVFALRKR